MSTLQLYLLITVMPNLSAISGVLIFAFGMAALIALIAGGVVYSTAYDAEEKELGQKILKYPKRFFIACMFFIAIAVITPSTKEVALIYAANYVTNNEQIVNLPPKLLALVHKYIDEALKDE